MAAGNCGVDVFFVLSGFIIYAVHRKDLGQPRKAGAFIRKRLIRIFPLYLFVMAVKLLLIPVPGLQSVRYSLFDVVSSATLLPIQGAKPVLSVSWSLTYEFFFYGLFLVAILTSERFLKILLPLWTATILLAIPLVEPGALKAVDLPLSPRDLGFILGILVAWAVERRPFHRRHAIVASYAGAAVFFGWFLAMDLVPDIDAVHPFARYVPAALGTAIALYGLVRLERDGAIRVPRALVFLGDASFSIYLVHIFVQANVWKALSPLPFVLASLILAALLVASGVLVYLCVERPLLHRLRRYAV